MTDEDTGMRTMTRFRVCVCCDSLFTQRISVVAELSERSSCPECTEVVEDLIEESRHTHCLYAYSRNRLRPYG